MKICKIHEVAFEGKLKELGNPHMVDFWIAKDCGEKFQAQVPNHPKLIEAFEWMSENDCLRHLQHVSPSYTTNIAEVEKIEAYNYQLAIMADQDRSRNSSLISKQYCMATGQVTTHVVGTMSVPERTFKVVWTFWSLQHAVMFKLAMGGSLAD
jgi:hypothetical protein